MLTPKPAKARANEKIQLKATTHLMTKRESLKPQTTVKNVLIVMAIKNTLIETLPTMIKNDSAFMLDSLKTIVRQQSFPSPLDQNKKKKENKPQNCMSNLRKPHVPVETKMPFSRHQVRPKAKAKAWSMSATKRLWIKVRNEFGSFLLLVEFSTRRGPDSTVDVFPKSVVLCFRLAPRESLDKSSTSQLGSRGCLLRVECVISTL